MSSSKKFNCTGALRVYRLKIADSSVHSVMLVFSTQLCDLYTVLSCVLVGMASNSTKAAENVYDTLISMHWGMVNDTCRHYSLS
jgi:hypothetical protein